MASKKNKWIKNFLNKHTPVGVVKEGVGYLKDYNKLRKSRKGRRKVTLKLFDQIKKERGDKASLEKVVERDARRESIGFKRRK